MAHRNTKLRVFLLVSLAAICTNCASVRAVRLVEVPAKLEGCGIKMFGTAQEIDRKYQSVGVLEIRGSESSIESYFTDMKIKACELGGDAIILDTGLIYSESDVPFASGWQGKATVIVFDDVRIQEQKQLNPTPP